MVSVVTLLEQRVWAAPLPSGAVIVTPDVPMGSVSAATTVGNAAASAAPIADSKRRIFWLRMCSGLPSTRGVRDSCWFPRVHGQGGPRDAATRALNARYRDAI